MLLHYRSNEHETPLQYSVYASLLIQVLTGLANMWILQYKTPSSVHIIRELVYAELAVQIVEVVFYIWLTYNLFKISNITPNRYYDWMFTTPTMLITLVAYFIFLKYKASYTDTSSLTLIGIVTKEYYQIITIVILNAVMLLFGYLGEVGKMGKKPLSFHGNNCILELFFTLFTKNMLLALKMRIQCFIYFLQYGRFTV